MFIFRIIPLKYSIPYNVYPNSLQKWVYEFDKTSIREISPWRNNSPINPNFTSQSNHSVKSFFSTRLVYLDLSYLGPNI